MTIAKLQLDNEQLATMAMIAKEMARYDALEEAAVAIDARWREMLGEAVIESVQAKPSHWANASHWAAKLVRSLKEKKP